MKMYYINTPTLVQHSIQYGYLLPNRFKLDEQGKYKQADTVLVEIKSISTSVVEAIKQELGLPGRVAMIEMPIEIAEKDGRVVDVRSNYSIISYPIMDRIPIIATHQANVLYNLAKTHNPLYYQPGEIELIKEKAIKDVEFMNTNYPADTYLTPTDPPKSPLLQAESTVYLKNYYYVSSRHNINKSIERKQLVPNYTIESKGILQQKKTLEVEHTRQGRSGKPDYKPLRQEYYENLVVITADWDEATRYWFMNNLDLIDLSVLKISIEPIDKGTEYHPDFGSLPIESTDKIIYTFPISFKKFEKMSFEKLDSQFNIESYKYSKQVSPLQSELR